MPMLIYNTTPILRLSDLKYPLYFSDLRADNPNTTFVYPLTSQEMRFFGYQEVYPVPKPEGDVVTKVKPELRSDGNYYEAWEVRSYTPDELYARIENEKVMLKDLSLNLYRIDLGRPIEIEIGNRTIWEIPTEDFLKNLNITKVISNLQPTVKFKIESIPVTDMSSAIFETIYNKVYTSFYNIYLNYIKFNDEVDATTTLEGLPELPETFIS